MKRRQRKVNANEQCYCGMYFDQAFIAPNPPAPTLKANCGDYIYTHICVSRKKVAGNWNDVAKFRPQRELYLCARLSGFLRTV